jgi:endogenous inhibitor of DNA gyrase (YacG/DUF329 family)
MTDKWFNKIIKRKCPACKRKIDEKDESAKKYYPFCSERCGLIDLGAWLDEEYKIVSDKKEQQEGENGQEGEKQK